MSYSSVNPSDRDTIESGGCMLGCGADVAGEVVECNACTRLKIGDKVWTGAEKAYSEYAVSAEHMTGLRYDWLSAPYWWGKLTVEVD